MNNDFFLYVTKFQIYPQHDANTADVNKPVAPDEQTICGSVYKERIVSQR